MFDKLGGRKFVLAVIVLAIGTTVQLVGRTPVTTEFASLLVGIMAAFGAANAVITAKGIAATGAEDDGGQSIADLAAALKATQEAADASIALQTKLNEVQASVASQGEAVTALTQSAQLTNNLLKAALGTRQ